MTTHGLRLPPGSWMRSESAPKAGAATIEIKAPIPRATPRALPLVASPTAALIWLGMVTMQDHGPLDVGCQPEKAEQRLLHGGHARAFVDDGSIAISMLSYSGRRDYGHIGRVRRTDDKYRREPANCRPQYRDEFDELQAPAAEIRDKGLTVFFVVILRHGVRQNNHKKP